MATHTGKNATVTYNGVSIHFDPEELADTLESLELECGSKIDSWTITINGGISEETTEPLGLMDQLIWGPLLN